MSRAKTRVAIACQGGGSHTAFTAGVLKALCEDRNKLLEHFTLVSLSGTSGGALCAFFIWYSAKKGDACVWKRLIDFWHDNTAQTRAERLFNAFAVNTMKLVDQGVLPQHGSSPSSPLVKMFFSMATRGQRSRFFNFQELLAAHIDFSELAAWGAQPDPPILLLGACNMLTGKLHQFTSYLEPIKLEHLLASAGVSSVVPAVPLETGIHWDGRSSDGPPVDGVFRRDRVGMENIPQELWLIKNGPATSDRTPVVPHEIADRRNQLESDRALFQSLREIEQVNIMMSRGAFRDEYMARADIREPVRIPKLVPEDPDRPWHIPTIEMPDALARTLTHEDTLDRAPEKINRLILEGEKQGRKFIEARLTLMARGGTARNASVESRRNPAALACDLNAT